GNKDFDYTLLENDIKALYKEDRKVTTIYNIFAVIAIIISCLGLFGISLFDIRQRYREIGIRKVNGAGMKDLYRLLFRKYFIVLGISFVVATPIAYYFIYQYTADFVIKAPIGIGIFVVALLLVALISLGTLFWQVRKAANINPADVIKSE
ncbi:MAG: FtsX-like permease family protein, partial [Bacteroides sp.]|nr:FtsX-like permease family protein [Bacteroides sp.]